MQKSSIFCKFILIVWFSISKKKKCTTKMHSTVLCIFIYLCFRIYILVVKYVTNGMNASGNWMKSRWTISIRLSLSDILFETSACTSGQRLMKLSVNMVAMAYLEYCKQKMTDLTDCLDYRKDNGSVFICVTEFYIISKRLRQWAQLKSWKYDSFFISTT